MCAATARRVKKQGIGEIDFACNRREHCSCLGATTEGDMPASDNLPKIDLAKQQIFEKPVPAVPARTFEIGLVLGGTVSAGAYTAGALELLVQALDAYYAAYDGAPPHAVTLRLATGSSGGAVCASILGVSLNRAFPYIADQAHPIDQNALNVDGAGPKDNKFWDLWVNQFQFLPMLDTDDLNAVVPDPPDPDTGKPATPQHVPSLINGKVIDAGTSNLIAYARNPGTISRPWATSPFRVATTVCNLRGVPFKVHVPTVGAYTGTSYVEHDDFAWFALPNQVGPESGDDGGKRRPDEFWVSSNPLPGLSVSYQTLGDFARASGAMPVVLPSRPLSRPAEHYLYRPYAGVDDNGIPVIRWPNPDWSELGDVTHGLPYGFTGVDGGTLNNDPVKIAHDALTGIGLTNPQGSADAYRAMFMIDPLADEPGQLTGVGGSAIAALGALIGTFVKGGRYLTSDLDLFQDEDVFSRFQLVPTRTGPDGTPLSGEAALAGTDLEALGGWCARPFRVHDYLLGRSNMAKYLATEFVLTGDNKLFDGWTFQQRADTCIDKNGARVAIIETTPAKNYFLPVIPIEPAELSVVEPAWPTGALDANGLQQLHDKIQARADQVLKKLRADNVPGFGPWLLSVLVLGSVAGTIADDVIEGLKTSLIKRGLL
jgi:hypothetical protein